MATPPAGWIDTGIVIGHSGQVTVQLAAIGQNGAEPLLVLGSVWIGIDLDFPVTDCGDWDSAGTVRLYTRKVTELPAAKTIEATVAGGCPQPYLSVIASRVTSGLRLIANVDVDTSSGETRLRYRLWADETTVDTLTVGSKVVPISHAGGELFTAPTIQIEHHAVPFIGFTPADLPNGVVLAGATWNSETDPTMFDSLALRGYNFGVGVGGVAWRYTTRPPMRYRLDVRIEDAAGIAPPGSVTAGTATVPNPGVQDVTDWRWVETAGAYPVRGTLAGDWSADGVALASGEEVVPLRQIKPKTPGSAPENWTPTIYAVDSPLSVLLSTNTFSGTGAVLLSGAGNQVWDIGGVATVTRILAATYDSADGYLTTKHVAGEDVWGWGLYAYLEVDLTAPANGDLTLTLTWVAAGASPVSVDKTYTLPVLSGANNLRVDLLFPNEGGPWYGERVSTIKFAGFQTGSYTLNSIELVAVENAYVKTHARGTYSGLVIAQDGSFAIGHWGDNPLIGGGPARQKDDESGLFDFGAGADTSEGGCVRMDGTLQDVADEWVRMEGILITYDDSAIDADLTDGVNVIGTEDELSAVPLTYTARWYHTLMGQRTPPTVTDNLPASLYLDGGADLCAAPAGTFVLPFHHVLGMVLEALAKDGVTGTRVGAGVPIYARRSTSGPPSPSDPLLSSGVTDASGFASVAIRTGTVGGANFYTALLDS